MEFARISINSEATALSILEKCAFSDTKCLSFYNTLLNVGIQQAVVLSTCNRSELYFIYEEESQIKQGIECFLKEMPKEANKYLEVQTGKEAFLMLFEVCVGMHSKIIGEDQIAHQIKKAYEVASECGACGKEMHKIFQTCLSCIRKYKANYHLNEYAVSIAYLAMQKIKQEREIKNCVIGIVGSGEIAQLLTRYAREEGFQKIVLCNRHSTHLQVEQNEEIIAFNKRALLLKQCDVLASATSSPHILWKKEDCEEIDHPLLLLDFALPRDFEESFKEMKNVTLWNIEDLQACVDENKKKRIACLNKVQPQLIQDVEKLEDWFLHHHKDTVIQSLQQQAQVMAQNTYELLNHKLTLSKREQSIVKKVLEASFYRMVKEPIQQLQKGAKQEQETYIEMLSYLLKGEKEQ